MHTNKGNCNALLRKSSGAKKMKKRESQQNAKAAAPPSLRGGVTPFVVFIFCHRTHPTPNPNRLSDFSHATQPVYERFHGM
jgi:hypothetical protein